MRKLLLITAGALSYLICSIVLTGYGNIHSHPQLNEIIVNTFVSKYNSVMDPNEKFYNYEFEFFDKEALTGIEISEGGIWDVYTNKTKKSVLGWIVHGGFSADEPQLEASFRHFYDPTEKVGQRYLKDLLDSWFVSMAKENPKVDHVQWAISHPDHEYNYTVGKEKLQLALETEDEKEREELMAFAWRALGETLHLIADMGIPCHVRDDAHPSKKVIVELGDPDPYEEVCEVIAREDGISSWLTGTVEAEVAGFSRSEFATAKTIAIKLAEWTNKNFFTNQTISGKWVTPRIHPEKTYASPKLDNLTWNRSTWSYEKSIGGTTVQLCKHQSIWGKWEYGDWDPYIDKECVITQAKALTPQIVEAGSEVIRCFIPKLEVQITDIRNDSIFGTVKHTPDDEHHHEIKYTGAVQIRRDSDEELIAEVKCEAGQIAFIFEPRNFDANEDKPYAEIEFGGITVRSAPFEPGQYTLVTVGITRISEENPMFTVTNSYVRWNSRGFSSPMDKALVWDGNSFRSSFERNYEGGNETQTITGTLSSNHQILESLKFRNYSSSSTSSTEWIFEFENVPMVVKSEITLASQIPEGQVKQYLKKLSYIQNKNGTERKIDEIWWTNIQGNIEFWVMTIGAEIEPSPIIKDYTE
jgi:hypothetical protein